MIFKKSRTVFKITVGKNMRTCFITKSWALPIVRALGTCAKYFVHPIYFTSSLKSTVQKPASKKKNPIFFLVLINVTLTLMRNLIYQGVNYM